MSKRFSLTVVAFCFALSVAEQASAYYAAHMGRFTSRDPNGEIGRNGMEMPPDAGMAMGFVDRDQFDPVAQYDGGMNLYQYVQGNPTGYTDSSGLDRELVIGGPLLIHQFIRTKCNGECVELHFSILGYQITGCANPGVVMQTIPSTAAEDQKLCDTWKDGPWPYIPFINDCSHATHFGGHNGIGGWTPPTSAPAPNPAIPHY